jgi:guanosine-3',5'-bis(diphosphate) 3'-pyrophosphohydrolase
MNIAVFLSALEFAANKHCGQYRKSKEKIPYINHPISVARLLAEVGRVRDQNILIAALLHDTIEDTDTTPEEITAAFGPEVCSLVLEVTDDKSLPKATRKQLQIDHAPSLSPGAALIKLADKICNVSDLCRVPPDGWTHERLVEYLLWADAVVRNLPVDNGPLLARFQEVASCGRQHFGLSS